MHPVSKERVEWVKARLTLLDEMFVELRDKSAKYITATGGDQWGTQQRAVSQALTNVTAERLQLRVELEVLSKLYGE